MLLAEARLKGEAALLVAATLLEAAVPPEQVETASPPADLMPLSVAEKPARARSRALRAAQGQGARRRSRALWVARGQVARAGCYSTLPLPRAEPP